MIYDLFQRFFLTQLSIVIVIVIAIVICNIEVEVEVAKALKHLYLPLGSTYLGT